MNVCRKSQVAMLTLVACLCLAFTKAESSQEDVRIWRTEPDSFDLILKSSFAGGGESQVVALNHRSGQTFFVKVGEKVGEYKVVSYEETTERIFKPTVNAYQSKKTGTVHLEGPDGEKVTLKQGKRVKQPGQLAYLISLDTGQWSTVRPGDRAQLDDVEISITSVDKKAVEAVVDEEDLSIKPISREEKDTLVARWAETDRLKRERAEAVRREKEDAAERAQVAVAAIPRPQPQVTEIRYRPRLFVGTEYPYPTEFEVLPGYYNNSGKMIRPPIAVPTRFKRRTSGMSVQYHTSGH
ncbi:MAG: hypothetical protein QGI24_03285 [Kiritimatiellia bacterium]|nr:hypothetical protein [Kiritimatiellia bacterium]MDP6847787.1 hypothetical protein [Kiritimatiellia bacterium]